MPLTSSAKKALRTARRRTVRNFARRSMVQTSVKALQEAVASGDPAKVAAAKATAMSHVDRAYKRGILHRNTAARRKVAIAALAAGKGVSSTKVTKTKTTKVAKAKTTKVAKEEAT